MALEKSPYDAQDLCPFVLLTAERLAGCVPDANFLVRREQPDSDDPSNRCSAALIAREPDGGDARGGRRLRVRQYVMADHAPPGSHCHLALKPPLGRPRRTFVLASGSAGVVGDDADGRACACALVHLSLIHI